MPTPQQQGVIADSDASAIAIEFYLRGLSPHVRVFDARGTQMMGERGLLHYSAVLNQLRFSRDPVALDVLSLQDLERQRKAADAPSVKTNLELYQNAALLEIGVSDAPHIDVRRLR